MKTDRAQGEGKSARSATEKSGNLRGHAPILRGFFRQSSTAAVCEPSGSSRESYERGSHRYGDGSKRLSAIRSSDFPAFGTVPPVDVFPGEDFADEEAALGVGDFDWGVFEDEEAAAFATVSTFVFKLSAGGSGTTESSMGMFALPS